MPAKLKQHEVIARFREVHGDRYDYAKFVYVGSMKKGVITCRLHGDFEQTHNRHTQGDGCPPCGENQRRTGTTVAIKRFKAVHGDRYIYDQVAYTILVEKVTIICREHGPFVQNPSNHWRGQGCISCRNIATSRLVSRRSRAKRHALRVAGELPSMGWHKKSRDQTKSAIESGEIIRHECCQVCDRDSNEVEIQAHHIHYDRPDSWHRLEWLCDDCHLTYGHNGHFHNPPISVVLEPVDKSVYNPLLFQPKQTFECQPTQDHGRMRRESA